MNSSNRIVAVSGRKGTGKTSFVHALALNRFEAGSRVIIVAPAGGLRLPLAPEIRRLGFNWGSLAGRSAVIYPEDEGLVEESFDFVWNVQEPLTPSHVPAPLWLVVDEVSLFLPPGKPSKGLLRIIRLGRHRQICLATTTQRPAEVHKNLIAQADDKVIFGQSEPNDIDYLRKWSGADPERLKSLPDMSYLRFCGLPEPVEGQVFYRYGVPQISLDTILRDL